MEYIHYYKSPMGRILLTADTTGLTQLLLEGEICNPEPDCTEESCPALEAAEKWLDIYFSENVPDFMPPLHMSGSPFQEEVWKLLEKIPYGSLTTYGQLAAVIAESRGIKRMSAQAVGGAVGSNPVSIIIPCHRVIGSGGNLTGYASGLENKKFLLELEGHNMNRFHDPEK